MPIESILQTKIQTYPNSREEKDKLTNLNQTSILTVFSNFWPHLNFCHSQLFCGTESAHCLCEIIIYSHIN